MGIRAVVYYLTTTFLAVLLGIGLVVLIQPGTHDATVDDDSTGAKKRPVNAVATFLNLIR